MIQGLTIWKESICSHKFLYKSVTHDSFKTISSTLQAITKSCILHHTHQNRTKHHIFFLYKPHIMGKSATDRFRHLFNHSLVASQHRHHRINPILFRSSSSMASHSSPFPVTAQNINPQVLKCQYVVRGEIVTLAQNLQKKFAGQSKRSLFDEIIY
ncbi:unnamed protein product [Vicia faba]|uniref:Uncharacterized protein n=1 Tax=Vicia faba TaxID=3906 RepID=A0AAV0ZWI1_VICFA|nr:unnamed protein product [Vicia faba]